MAFSFDVEVDQDISTILREVEQKIKDAGGRFDGNEQNGTFSGKGVRGKYSINGQKIRITITDKPWIASENLVKSKITDYFTV
jgi:hypothetical protein